MYLTKLDLDISRRSARKYLGSPQVMHAVVMRACYGNPGSPQEITGRGKPSKNPTISYDQPRVLWRVDQGGYGTVLYIVSPDLPDMSQLEFEAGNTLSPSKSATYKPFLDQLEMGQEWGFRLTANPTRSASRGEGQRGKRYGHVTAAQQLQWLIERAEKSGFSLISDQLISDSHESEPRPSAKITARERIGFGRNTNGSPRRVTINRVTFEGILRVSEPEALRKVLTQGIGPSKAYGCGLLTLAPRK